MQAGLGDAGLLPAPYMQGAPLPGPFAPPPACGYPSGVAAAPGLYLAASATPKASPAPSWLMTPPGSSAGAAPLPPADGEGGPSPWASMLMQHVAAMMEEVSDDISNNDFEAMYRDFFL